jgi:hypothetical protein
MTGRDLVKSGVVFDEDEAGKEEGGENEDSEKGVGDVQE